MPIEIPVVQIAPTGEIFKPTTGDLESGINKKLNARTMNSVAGSRHHRLIPMTPTSPHTTGDHMVFWTDANSTNTQEVTSWNSESWQELLEDTVFLSNVEKHFHTIQKGNPVVKIYMYLGFIKPSSDTPNTQFAIPLQSQNRPHFHASELVNTWSNPDMRDLDFEDPKDQRQLGFFLNAAGEKAISDYKSELEDYGTRILYTQKLGHGNETKTLKRTIYGFSSLQEALQKSVELQRRVSPTWSEYIYNLSKQTVDFDGVRIPLIQSYVPNIAIIIPSDEDRKNGNTNDNFVVWTIPFATVGAQVLVPGGVITERATPYDLSSK
jgi:hypothetical protein